MDVPIVDYTVLDRPEVVNHLFYPRREWQMEKRFSTAQDIMIPVDREVAVGGRFHAAGKGARNILFFHGNGEIVSDYDDLAALYNRMNINFLPVDYRGYGRSGGSPTVSAMMKDCHAIFEFVRNWLKDQGYTGPLVVMGRSLGSASALELAATRGKEIDGLIIESGFAYAGPLLELLGVDAGAIGFREEEGFRNVDKIRSFNKPTLVIHAERDHIIPFGDGQALFEASPAEKKVLLKIQGANHNDIFERGLAEYMAAIRTFTDDLR
jgi:fermentation-respiration switch protein FrsA (DUF1100 family)